MRFGFRFSTEKRDDFPRKKIVASTATAFTRAATNPGAPNLLKHTHDTVPSPTLPVVFPTANVGDR